MSRFLPRLLILICLCTTSLSPLRAEEEDDQPTKDAYLSVQVDQNGEADLTFSISCSTPLTSQQIQAINQALGFSINAHQIASEAAATEGESALANEKQNFHSYFGRGEKQFQKTGQKIDEAFNLMPLFASLQPTGTQYVIATVALPNQAQSTLPPANAGSIMPLDGLSLHTYHIPVDGSAEQSLRISFGYSQEIMAGTFAVLFGVLLLPIVGTLLLAFSMLRKHRRHPQQSEIAALGPLNLIAHLLPVLWWIALYYSHAADFIAPWLKSSSPWISHPTRLALYVLPPIVASLICNAIYHYAIATIKAEGKSAAAIFAQAGLSVIVTFVPMILLYNGLFALISGAPRQGVFFFVAYVALQTFTAKWQWKAMGFTPYILPNGKLRNRAFALANQAGVKLQQIFLIADQNGQTANAFAASGNNIMLTEYLLRQFSRREVDFITSHELAHLQYKHTSKKALITLVTFPVMILFASMFGVGIAFLGLLIPSILKFFLHNGFPIILLLAIGIATLVELFISRRFEFSADAGGVALTGDPEAAITALARLGRLNLEPMEWGKFNGKFLSHPSVLRRVQAIAKKHSITPERVQDLLSLSLLDPSRYSIQDEIITAPMAALKASPNQTPAMELPQGKPIPFTLAPILYGIFGVGIGWLITSPGYFLREILDEYHIPSFALIGSLGLLLAGWQCVVIKRKLLGLLADQVIFNPTNVMVSPTITTVIEMDEILSYTNDLEAAGFRFLGDYQLVTEPRSRALGFIRIFQHPVYHCYAEVAQIVNVLNRPRPVCCTLISDYGEGWSFSTTGRDLDGVFFAFRNNQTFWHSNPGAAPTNLLEIHLEQREVMTKQHERQVVSETSADNFIANTNRSAQTRKARYQQKNIIQFMLEADFCSTQQKREWFGKKGSKKKTALRPTNSTLAPEVKA